MTLAVAALIATSGVAAANGDSGKCFDKSTLSYVECPGGVDWTGPYLGFDIGLRSDDWDIDDAQGFSPNAAGNVVLAVPVQSATSASLDDTSFRFGVSAGYDLQLDRLFVVGVEADVGIADNDDTLDFIPYLPPQGASGLEFQSDFDASLRLKAGVLASDDLLLYATGGLALMDLEITASCPADTLICNPGVGTQTRSKDELLVGYTVGAGAVYQFDENWRLNAEYRFADYGTYDATFFIANNNLFGAEGDVDVQSHIARIGFQYKF